MGAKGATEGPASESTARRLVDELIGWDRSSRTTKSKKG